MLGDASTIAVFSDLDIAAVKSSRFGSSSRRRSKPIA